ncbi:MAG TPA: M15 family metallopeptidase, partial [Gaiellaceae bacterium]|nr:M15 family metallopeptidase [Gaiellaceae bacterium]
YVGCGMTRDKTALAYLDRSRHRPGMVTPAVVRAFASIGWGWGGAWTGSTKDYMHFSSNGH